MREIKLRAFHKPTKKMFDVVLIDFLNGFVFSYEEIFGMSKHSYSDTISYELKDCELLQYTGLKDVDGKEIFEGDIVVIPDHYPYYHEGKLNYVAFIEFIFSSWQYVLTCVAKDRRGISSGVNDQLNQEGFQENEKTYFKILGNIYENKELLEVK